MDVIPSTQSSPKSGRLPSYVTGFVLATSLTAASFWIVMGGSVSQSTAVAGVVVFALAQIIVHLIFFLHLNGSSDQRWNRMALIFAALIVVILVGGSLWIMTHLNHNMMPMRME